MEQGNCSHQLPPGSSFSTRDSSAEPITHAWEARIPRKLFQGEGWDGVLIFKAKLLSSDKRNTQKQGRTKVCGIALSLGVSESKNNSNLSPRREISSYLSGALPSEKVGAKR